MRQPLPGCPHRQVATPGAFALRSWLMSGSYVLVAALLLLVVAAGFASVGLVGYEVVRLVGSVILAIVAAAGRRRPPALTVRLGFPFGRGGTRSMKTATSDAGFCIGLTRTRKLRGRGWDLRPRRCF
jgi:hypothetical protein